MAITKACSVVTDWTAVAQNTIVASAVFDLSDAYGALMHIQAALDSTTAHTGTKFTVQVSGASTGNEDWSDLFGGGFVELVGTATADAIEDNPLAALSTTIALTGHSYTTEGVWLFIEDGTLANSELVFEKAQAANSVTILNGTTNAHVQTTAMYNVAFAKTLVLPGDAYRARLVVDNSYSPSGSTLDYKVGMTKSTAV